MAQQTRTKGEARRKLRAFFLRKMPKCLWRPTFRLVYWLFIYDGKRPAFDYSKSATTGFIAVFGTFTTISMAYGFSNIGIDSTEDSLRYWVFGVGSLVLISIGFQVLREQALARRTKKAEAKAQKAQRDLSKKQQAVKTQTENLTTLLKSMPPAQALSTFTESFHSILFNWRFRPRLASNATPLEKDLAIDFFQENIRYSLNAIAQLLIHYEHKPLDTECSAYLSEYVSLKDVENDSDFEERVKQKIRFVDDRNNPFRGLTGVLHVNPAMSARAKRGQPEESAGSPDPQITDEFFLPVADCTDEDEKALSSRAIPIGPRAFRFGQTLYESVPSEITQSEAWRWNVTPKVAKEIVDYFEGLEHGRAGSAVAQRLDWQVQSDEGKKADPSEWPRMGVVTILTELPTDLDNSVISAYWDLVQPIVELQKDMLLEIVKLRA